MERGEAGARSANALAAESLGRSGRLRIRATGASMLPALVPGDELEFDACDLADLVPGDVALFRRGERLLAHRVLRIDGDVLTAQGDALAAPDPVVPAADVLGKLVAIGRAGQPSRVGLSLAQRACRWLLRRSDLATRLYLGWHRRSTRVLA
jgi:hypothetical protein